MIAQCYSFKEYAALRAIYCTCGEVHPLPMAHAEDCVFRLPVDTLLELEHLAPDDDLPEDLPEPKKPHWWQSGVVWRRILAPPLIIIPTAYVNPILGLLVVFCLATIEYLAFDRNSHV